jgi:hypothetical protein
MSDSEMDLAIEIIEFRKKLDPTFDELITPTELLVTDLL